MSTDDRQRLADVVEAQVRRVEDRVVSGGGVYATEIDEVRVAAGRIAELTHVLGLGEFLGPVGHVKSKPQFLLRFANGAGEPVVLKVYGRVRPGEALTQRLWHSQGVSVVEVLAGGDHPTSWLLLEDLAARSVAWDRLTLDELVAVTQELAGQLDLAHAVPPAGASAATHLAEALERHLGKVLPVLDRHGYVLDLDWREWLARVAPSSPPVLLHGDLGGGNVLRRATGGGLVLLDACGYLGPPEFDAARWAARTGGAEQARRVLLAWLTREQDLDPETAHAFLGLELAMEAGVRELVKDERGESSDTEDPRTLALLDGAVALLR